MSRSATPPVTQDDTHPAATPPGRDLGSVMSALWANENVAIVTAAPSPPATNSHGTGDVAYVR
jgi:hypothetical protein